MKKLPISEILCAWNYFYTIRTDYGLSRNILWEEIGLILWGDEFEKRGNAIAQLIWGVIP